jgi:hypothetical protein
MDASNHNTTEANFVRTGFFTRWPCHVCGGHTEKVEVLTEVKCVDGDVALRVCETCLEAGDIDKRLEDHAARLVSEAARLRNLIGRLKVPTFAQWKEKEADCHLEARASYGNAGEFGLCPECHRSDGYFNVGRSHWRFCKWHRLKWCFGSNLFSDWKGETEEEQRKTYERLEFGTFQEITPYYPAALEAYPSMDLDISESARALLSEKVDLDNRAAVEALLINPYKDSPISSRFVDECISTAKFRTDHPIDAEIPF